MEMLNPRISSDTLFMLWSYDESVIDVESNSEVKSVLMAIFLILEEFEDSIT